jgi:hypothetical protein
MILTVHDEIVFEIHKDIIGEAIPLLCNLMVRNKAIAKMGWIVPLTVDVEIGKDWSVPYDLKELREGKGEDEFLVSVFKEEHKEIKDPGVSKLMVEEVKADVEYEVKELSDESAKNLVGWLKEHRDKKVKVVFENRDITSLIKL